MTEKWIDIFALSQFRAGIAKLPFGGRTVRIIIRNFIKGNKIRLTLANRYGKKGINISKVSVCNSDVNGKLLGESKIMTFNSEEYGIVRAKSSLTSDDMDYNIEEGYLSVSLFFKGRANISSLNMLREKVIISNKGDFTLNQEIIDSNRYVEKFLSKLFKIAGVPKSDIIPMLESVSVFSDTDKGAIIAFGDSITQGGKWSYELAERLKTPVLNLSISGNRILRDCGMPIVRGLMGEAAIKRFDRDVITRQGAKAIIIMLGTNDIGQPGTIIASKKEMVRPNDVINGLVSLDKRAKSIGLNTFVCTLTAFKHFRMGYIRDAMQVRQDTNKWIRENKIFNGVYDYDAMIRDTEDTEKIQKDYDSGDHLHPSDLGSVRMLDAVDINVLEEIIKDKK